MVPARTEKERSRIACTNPLSAIRWEEPTPLRVEADALMLARVATALGTLLRPAAVAAGTRAPAVAELDAAAPAWCAGRVGPTTHARRGGQRRVARGQSPATHRWI